MKFYNRADAGLRLGEFVAACIHEPTLVFATPLGGVPVAAEAARILRAPLDVVMAGDVSIPPLGVVGALALGASPVPDRAILRGISVGPTGMNGAVERVRASLSELLPRLRGDRPLPDPAGRTVIIVDEGLETGYRALAAVRMLHAHGAARIVVAAPVCSPVAEERLAPAVDELVYLSCPEDYGTTRSYYENFDPVTIADAVALLSHAKDCGADLYGGAEIDGLPAA